MPATQPAIDWQAAYEIIDTVSTISAIPVAVVGFGIAYWQIIKTRNAADAARKAVIEVRSEVRRDNMLVLLPQLQRIEDELDRAVSSGSAELAVAWLSTWRWQAGQVRGYLSTAVVPEKKLLKAIQNSVSAAAAAKTELSGNTSPHLITTLRRVRELIAVVTNEIGALAAVGASQGGGSP